MSEEEDTRDRLWSVGFSGLSGMHYKVIARSFEEALAKTHKLAEQVRKENEEKDLREIEWISLEEAEIVS